MFDRVLTPESRNEDIFVTLAPFLGGVFVARERVMIIADGVSDAGKTFTLLLGHNALLPAIVA